MAKQIGAFNFQDIFEEHPIKSCIGCFLTGIGLTYTVLSFLYEDKIQNIKDRYEDKIEMLKKTHEQDLEIKEIKLSKEEGTNYYLNVKPDSKLAKDLSKLINPDKE
ncbi:hypothetical protein [Flavobacterium reichenbachii]|uniref:Uncharacterized protein n=1 Tax=Flavobacterium reichenbachii TaxID=362418 RepID=A0A085ZNQ7_9FLAO|nr:hypothetical protein [Flavobacterium reichenbachii]KFF06071.1 hypothetical protein IW19_11280 [Flavobacterium reichenbachii]OXB14704.1 hypothetical protein B0A68_11665 [Flavobacterium reichenbachii]